MKFGSKGVQVTVGRNATIRSVLKVMKSEKMEEIPVVDEERSRLVDFIQLN